MGMTSRELGLGSDVWVRCRARRISSRFTQDERLGRAEGEDVGDGRTSG